MYLPLPRSLTDCENKVVDSKATNVHKIARLNILNYCFLLVIKFVVLKYYLQRYKKVVKRQFFYSFFYNHVAISKLFVTFAKNITQYTQNKIHEEYIVDLLPIHLPNATGTNHRDASVR
jgi:hypothetical protein